MSFVNSETVKLQVEAFRGAQGPAGEDGYSPEITLTRGESGGKSGVWISVTNANSSDMQFVYDGEDGAAGEGSGGVSTAVTVTAITGGHRVTITDANGTQTFDVMNGASGADGHTPVRGMDYWTEADKEEMVADVLAALPNASGVSF